MDVSAFSHLWFIVISTSSLLQPCIGHSSHAMVLLISLDGFRWDYLDMVKMKNRTTPNFDSIIADGVKAEWVQDSFVTKTFPNHYTIVTGMYEENHGVVSNEMYDPKFHEVFRNTAEQNRGSKWWNNGSYTWPGEPVWYTNEKEDNPVFPKRSGVYFWPGSESQLHVGSPTYYMRYNQSVPWETRVDTVLKWFIDDEKPINLGLLYYHQPDHAGHMYGPDSTQMADMIVELDKNIGYLLSRLKEKLLYQNMNLVITSDHGMSQITDYIYFDDYLDSSLYKKFGSSPMWNILPNEGSEDIVYQKLQKMKNALVFKKENMPDRLHYKNNRRIMPIIVFANDGYQLVKNASEKSNTSGGNHGYDNNVKHMHPFFIAHGPVFKKGYRCLPLRIVDIYPLLCHLLDVEPAVNDGNLENIEHILAPHENSLMTLITFLAAVGVAATISGIYCVAACRIRHITQRRLITAISLNKVSMDGIDGHTPLLTSDEEEIP